MIFYLSFRIIISISDCRSFFTSQKKTTTHQKKVKKLPILRASINSVLRTKDVSFPR